MLTLLSSVVLDVVGNTDRVALLGLDELDDVMVVADIVCC